MRRANCMRWTGLAALALAALALGGAWAIGSQMTSPGASAVDAASPPARDFVLTSEDGLSIAATYWPGAATNAPAVLLLHGLDGSRMQVIANAAWLSRLGYAAMAIDFRGHGQSTSAPRSIGWNEARDAHAAFDWLKQSQHNAQVAVLGISQGGAAALLGKAGPLPADALILQAVYPDIRHAVRNRIAARVGVAPAILLEPLISYQSLPRFGLWPSELDPLKTLRSFHNPVLVIGGGADLFTPPDETRAMYEAAPGVKELWLAPGLDHSGVSDLQTEEYRMKVAAFLKMTIAPPLP